MLKKYGKFFADWTNEHEKRQHKAFPTLKAAKRYQQKVSGTPLTPRQKPRKLASQEAPGSRRERKMWC